MEAATTTDAVRTLEEANARSIARRDRFRRELAEGRTDRDEFQTLKHQFPYMGFVPCRAEGQRFQMFHCNDDVVAWEYFWLGDDAYERPIVRQWLAWARTAERVLDVGAYTGLMSILACLANPRATVHALEPIERTVERTKINVRANGVGGRVTLHARAASDEFGLDMINYYRDENFLGTGNSLHDKGMKVMARRMIQTVNLDQYLGSKHTFDLVKIDVEGFEIAVLDGMSRMLRRDRPRMVLEVWKENEAAVHERLERLRYDWRQVEDRPARVVNYLCAPRN
jgi:FkbM family methyltransferase